MKAVETLGTINKNGQISLDEPLIFPQGSRVKVIVLLPELNDQTKSSQEEVQQPVNSYSTDYNPSLQKWEFVEPMLADMASDPQIQREITMISTEFEMAELDGLERL